MFMLAFLLTFSNVIFAADLPATINFALITSPVVHLHKSKAHLVKQPVGPFAAMIFYEDALGVQVGVIYLDIMGIPVQGKWHLSDRFWQDKKWASDATSIAWSSEGSYLYVATSSIYGDGGVFQLDLFEKKSERIYPKKEATNLGILHTEIIDIDKSENILKIKVTYDDEKTVKIVKVPLK